MGTDICSVFQKKTDDGWVDVESNFKEDRDDDLFAWIGNSHNKFGLDRIEPLSDNRGFPDGFTVADNNNHPILSNAIRGDLARWYAEEDEEALRNGEKILMWMGNLSHSWLSADEILTAPLSSERKQQFAYFIDEVARLKKLYGEVRFVFGFDN